MDNLLQLNYYQYVQISLHNCHPHFYKCVVEVSLLSLHQFDVMVKCNLIFRFLVQVKSVMQSAQKLILIQLLWALVLNDGCLVA